MRVLIIWLSDYCMIHLGESTHNVCKRIGIYGSYGKKKKKQRNISTLSLSVGYVGHNLNYDNDD